MDNSWCPTYEIFQCEHHHLGREARSLHPWGMHMLSSTHQLAYSQTPSLCLAMWTSGTITPEIPWWPGSQAVNQHFQPCAMCGFLEEAAKTTVGYFVPHEKWLLALLWLSQELYHHLLCRKDHVCFWIRIIFLFTIVHIAQKSLWEDFYLGSGDTNNCNKTRCFDLHSDGDNGIASHATGVLWGKLWLDAHFHHIACGQMC